MDIISVSVVKPDNGRYSHRVADIQCVQQELRVDNNGNRRDAIFSQQIHHGAIEQECRDGCCQLAHHFGGAIETALPNHGPFQFWPCERQRSFAPRKIDQPGNRGDQIAEACPQSSAPDAQAAGDNEKVIQNSRKLDRLSQITAYMEENYREDISLESLAEIFGYSATYLSRMFRKYAKTNYKACLDDIRLEHAVKDLADTRLPIGEVVLRNGFPNSRAFVKVFKKRYGMLPKEYRRMMQPFS